jgi:hypothetical protein
VEFAYDLGRVDKNSDSRRVVAGTFQDIQVEYWWDRDDREPVDYEYDAPYDGGAVVLHFDNAVGWAPKVKSEEQWDRNNLTAVNGTRTSPGSRQTRFKAYGYVPNPRMDEDQDYNPRQDNLSTDNDDIYVIECDTDGDPVTDDPVSDPQGGEYGDCPGWLSPVGEAHPGSTGWRPVYNMGHSYMDRDFSGEHRGLVDPDSDSYGTRKIQMATLTGDGKKNTWGASWIFPQRGPYANEIRWNKHDSRIVAMPPFYRGGGMGHELDQNNPGGQPTD